MVVLYDEEGEVIGDVKYNNVLDMWDGDNYVNGGTGKHKGFGQLKDGRFYMIYGTQWQGQNSYAELTEAKDIVAEAIRTGNIGELKAFPELMKIYDEKFIHE